ncbi:MAG TPA: VOC family protein [Hyphomonadaceae bacterium]|nr:VOC family protein [Hyphomonadaceae bacterium]
MDAYDGTIGRFCWLDLAAIDSDAAMEFYGDLFGWTAHRQRANGGSFTRLKLGGRDVGSLYQMSREQMTDGWPSHWTPYVRVADVDAKLARARALGATTIAPPFDVDGTARVAVMQDPVGAVIGLWGPLLGSRS